MNETEKQYHRQDEPNQSAPQHGRAMDKLSLASDQAFDLLDSINEAFYGLDSDWCFIYVNRKAEQLWNRKREGLIGKNIWEEFPQGVNTQAYQAMHRALDEQQCVQFETFSSFLNAWVEAEVNPTRRGLSVYFRDITRRKQAEEQLARMATMIAFSNDAIISETLDGTITSWNAGAEDIFGYSAQEIIGQSIRLVIPPDKQGEEGMLLQKIAAGETVHNYDTIRLNKEGHEVFVAVSLSPLKDEQGTIIGASKISRNVTERKREEVQLRRSEAALKQAQSVAHVGSWAWHIQSNHLEWSDEMYRIFGIQKTSFTGDLSEVIGHAIHPDDRAAVERANEAVIQDKRPSPLEYRVVWPDGTVRVVWAEPGEMMLDTVGNPAVLTGIVQDITERKQAEAVLHRYTERLAAINRLDRIISSSIDIGQVYDNFVEEMQSLLPLDRTAIVRLSETGDQWQVTRQWTQHQPAILPGAWRPVLGSVIEWLVTNRIPFSEPEIGEHGNWPETAILQHEGIRSRLLLPLILQERVVGVLTVASRQPAAFSEEDQSILMTIADQLSIAIQNSDLYERVQHHATELEQRVIERTAQLEASNKELEAFSYSVSHDLRAPLRAMDGFSRILLEEYVPSIPSEAQRYLHLVRDNAQQMGRLIDDLLTFSRLSRQPLNKQPVDFGLLARKVFDDLYALEMERVVEITIGALPSCEADPALLKQVFANLLGNALKFTQTREVARIEVDYHQTDGEKVYYVRDNGVGFDMQYAHKLFGVFQRLHRAEDYAGTGVGLATVQRILHRHGGRIWAEAKVDQGATFYFTLEGESQNERE